MVRHFLSSEQRAQIRTRVKTKKPRMYIRGFFAFRGLCEVCERKELFLHLVLRVDDVVVLLARTGAGGAAVGGGFRTRARPARARRRSGAAAAGGAVNLLGQLVADVRHVLRRLLDPVGILALDRIAQVVQRAFDAAAHVRRNLVAIFAQRFLRRVRQTLGLILQVDRLAPLLVFGGVSLGVTLHLFDL